MSRPEPVPATSTSVLSDAGSKKLFGDCWSCRILSGGGLLLSAGYVYLGVRKVMAKGGITTVGNVAQIAFSLSLAAWGIVILADPVGKSHRKT